MGGEGVKGHVRSVRMGIHGHTFNTDYNNSYPNMYLLK